MAQFNITITKELLHGLFLSNGRDEAFSKLLEEIFNQVLLTQSSEQLRAEPMSEPESGQHTAMDIEIYPDRHDYTAGSPSSKWPILYRAICPVSA